MSDAIGPANHPMQSNDDAAAAIAFLVRAFGFEERSRMEDQPHGERVYTARDPEGHVWHFSTPIRGHESE